MRNADLGKLGEDEEFVFQLFYFGRANDSSNLGIYGLQLLRNEKSGAGRLFLTARMRPTRIAALSPASVSKILSVAEPVVADTHYRSRHCDVPWVDGYIVSVASGSSSRPAELRGGEAYSPVSGSPADRLVLLGYLMYSIVAGNRVEGELDSF